MKKDSRDAIMGLSLLIAILYFTFPIIKDIPDKYALIYYVRLIFGSMSLKVDNAFAGIIAGVFQSLILTLPLLIYIYLVIIGIVDISKKRNKFKAFIPSTIALCCNIITVMLFLIMPSIKISENDKAFKVIFVSIFTYGEPCFLLYLSLIISCVLFILSLVNFLSKKDIKK